MSNCLAHRNVILPAVFLLVSSTPGYAFANLIYQSSVPADYDVAIDTRAESECLQDSLPKAVCVPPAHLIAGHNRLANFSGLFWLLGTAGLSGSEHVVIIGDNSTHSDFMAGWLYVAGQSRITVIDQSVSEFFTQAIKKEPGRSRGNTRKVMYTAQSRTQLLILKSELQQHLESTDTITLFDGRSESEYWSQLVIAARGGHIPGAIHLKDPSRLGATVTEPLFAYAHDSVSGLAYLARLVANNIDAKLYLGGWVEWAADGTLSIDAATYPRRQKASATQTAIPEKSNVATRNAATRFALIVAALVIALSMLVAAYRLGRFNGLKT